MTDQRVATSVTPPAIELAWQLLAATVADDAFADIALTEAADALTDVYPPYPPARAVLEHYSQPQGISATLTALRSASRAATTVEERLRIAAVVGLLRPLTRDP